MEEDAVGEREASHGWVGVEGAMEDGAAVIERKREGGLELGFQETIRRFRATHFYLFFFSNSNIFCK
jgi:hypothetical protein